MHSASILLVEDEVLIRMMIAEMLEELGCRVAAETGNVEQAIVLAQQASFDAALLDINLGGVLVTPVAEIVCARRRPLIFASGYGMAGVPEGFDGCPVLQKPFEVTALRNALDSVLGTPQFAGSPAMNGVSLS
jgi:CheY-like chemotaxis protein